MCTVTFIPLANNDFMLCSNRDESPKRKTLPPSKHIVNGVTAVFPQDALAGGTWIGSSQLERVACIMNGGFEPYNMHQKFAKSRGLIVTEVLTTPSLPKYFEEISLRGIAPFTLLVLQYRSQLALTEYVWDGAQLHSASLPITTKIWSSRQLYTPEIAAKRETWFQNFLEQGDLEQDALLKFHKEAGNGDPKSNLVMDRGVVKTTSISCFTKHKEQVAFRYQQIDNGEVVYMSL